MNRSVLDTGGGVLVVSQFTLFGDARERPAAFLLLRRGSAHGPRFVPRGPRNPSPDRGHRCQRGVSGRHGGVVHQHGAGDHPPGFGEEVLTPSVRRFRALLWTHYRENARPMPWRKTRNPYRILVSEVMLQQTERCAGDGEVRAVHSGLSEHEVSRLGSDAGASLHVEGPGYNRRALSLRAAAQILVSDNRGKVPRALDALVSLPGVGHATAAAVLPTPTKWPSPSWKRTYAGYFFISFFPGGRVPDARIVPLVEKTLDRSNPREWFYALMDYGAMSSGRAAKMPIGKASATAPRRRLKVPSDSSAERSLPRC